MNRCGRTFLTGDWRASLNALLSLLRTRENCHRWSAEALCLSRGQATAAATQAPDAEKRKQPQLRAIDLARKLQQEEPKVQANEAPMSSVQKKVVELKRFSLQLQKVHPNVLAKHLSRNVLYQNQHVVLINKPYNVPLRDSSKDTSISSVLPVVAKMMDGMKARCESQLLPCLGLEKEMTGVLLLARSEEAVEHIYELHRSNQVQRKYWIVTVGVPVPSEGIIDIPIIEREVAGPPSHFKMGLSPVYRMNEKGTGLTKMRAHRQALPAATKYKVLDSGSGCSLVELQAFTGVKHQLRVHMACALACPILGDHKYSHQSKLAPQKLPEGVLGKLRLEQSKVRYVPLHLHAREMTLPGSIQVSCPLPKFFIQTLSQLHLTFPKQKDDK
ncbi:pseudouridylate synthase RPUSD4, mitochondrial-like [Nerophis lumbriciformis]|uniref:pseudouridylate synthase RPUSD4, mitochondrial-like n=1 Tax=Nerophis lumbriciformis TaxID=546530 RepID=UPI002AE061E1|nr:pseudouridylate synthase RPUSD4, mitochondrial-like [Nerophis lumbriciformis]